MHFAAVALAFATAVSAHQQDVLYSTYYSTEHITVTACHPTVTNCPTRPTSTVYTLTTSVPIFPTAPNATAPYPLPPINTPPPQVNRNPVLESSSCPGSVKTISTWIPTVIYETVPGTCAPPAPTSPPLPPVVQPVNPPYAPPPSNTTATRPTYTQPSRPTGTSPVTAGASAMGASAVLLALGLATAIFA